MNVDLMVNSKLPEPITPRFTDLGELGYAFTLTTKHAVRDDGRDAYPSFVNDVISFFMLKPEMMDEFIDNLTTKWAEFKQRKYGAAPDDDYDFFTHEELEAMVPAGVGHF